MRSHHRPELKLRAERLKPAGSRLMLHQNRDSGRFSVLWPFSLGVQPQAIERARYPKNFWNEPLVER